MKRSGKNVSGPVIFDLEFTGWEGSVQHGWTRPGEFREVVQIGAVKLSPVNLNAIDEFEILVQPRLNPVLSNFLTELTGITNEQLAASGVDFITAWRAFLDFADGSHLWAHGRDDLVIASNLKLYGWDGQLTLPPYTNSIMWFLEHGVDLRGKHACDAPEAVGASFTGRKHNALADAAGVATAIRTLIANGAPNPF
jgi:inhibitor of KinA sporulation pathway (predicted exonuclease)